MNISSHKIHKKYTLLALLGLLLTGACTKEFDSLNTNPNNPTTVNSNVLLPTAIEAAVDRYWGHQTRYERMNLDGGMLWVQYLSRNIYSGEGDNYSVSPAFHENNWKGFYNDALMNFQKIILQSGAEAKSPHTNYEGVALTMRSWVFSILTDAYGAIPYSDALKGTAEPRIYTPVYDSQEAVYAGLLEDLKLANEKLVVGGPKISGDILFGGDILRWKKMANSLRLRLANRQAAKKPAESRAIMSEILGNPAQFPVFTDNKDFAYLQHTAVIPSNNEWNQVIVQTSRGDWNISKTLADKLNALNDARITVFAQPNKAGQYAGHANGLPDAIATSASGNSSQLGKAFTLTTTPSVIMSYSELLFVLAEAAFDKDIDGDAQAYFEKAVKASFAQYSLTATDDFITKLGPVTKEKIMEQKWIALFGQGVEAWTEYRRTGLPTMPPADPRAVFLNDGILPTRLKYPSSEYSLNSSNVEKGIALNGGPNDMTTKLWWAE